MYLGYLKLSLTVYISVYVSSYTDDDCGVYGKGHKAQSVNDIRYLTDTIVPTGTATITLVTLLWSRTDITFGYAYLVLLVYCGYMRITIN